MPQVVSLGPLAMATDRMLAIGAIWAFLLLMMLIGQRRRHATSRSAWLAVIAGLVVARLAYVALNWAAFSGDWIAMLAFCRGGFGLWSGAIAAGLVQIGRAHV